MFHKLNKIHFCYIFIVIFLCIGSGASANESNILFDFEQKDSIKDWQIDKGASAEVVSHKAISGKYSMRLVFMSGYKWPAVRALAGKALNRSDFTGFDNFIFTVRNPGSSPAFFVVKIKDRDGNSIRQSFKLAPIFTGKISMPLNIDKSATSPAPSLDKIESIIFYTASPESDIVMMIDNIRLGNSAYEKMTDYHKRLTNLINLDIKSKINNITKDSDLYILAEDIAPLYKQISDNLDKHHLNKTFFPSTEQIEKWEHRLLKLEALPELLELLKQKDNKQFAVKTAGPMKKAHIYLSRIKTKLENDNQIKVALAKNEYESRQLILIPLTNSLKDLGWQISDITNEKGVKLNASVKIVGYVKCKEPPYQVQFSGWWPDPLLSGFSHISEVPVGEILALWITVHAPSNALTGIYSGCIDISQDGKRLTSLPVKADVLDFEIPERSTIPAISTVHHNHRNYMKKLYGPENWQKMKNKFEDFCLLYRISPTDMYTQPSEQWSSQRLKELIDGGMSVFVLAQFGHHAITEENIQNYHSKRLEELDIWKENFKKLKQLGWQGPVVICGYDEAPEKSRNVIIKSIELLKNHLPEEVIFLPVGTLDPNFGNDWPTKSKPEHWVIIIPKFDSQAAAIEIFRQRGGKPWMYTCLSAAHPYPMYFVEYAGLEPRLMGGAFLWKYDAAGWLYYHCCRWPKNESPLKAIDGRRTDWEPASNTTHNGSGSLIYAGPAGPVATVRLENQRDGFEDYEYYCLANKKYIQKYGKQLQVSPDVVEDTKNWTENPSDIEAEKKRLIKIILGCSAK